MTEERKPYWLIREPGKLHGLMTIEVDEAITAEKALEIARERFEEDFKLHAPAMEAVLVKLTYRNGDPVVTELTSS
jgi:hypothetical protein